VAHEPRTITQSGHLQQVKTVGKSATACDLALRLMAGRLLDLAGWSGYPSIAVLSINRGDRRDVPRGDIVLPASHPGRDAQCLLDDAVGALQKVDWNG
jgi:hypothetical protein